MKILVVGAHPDDPESGCGGMAANCVQQGHDVVFMYCTPFRRGREYFKRPEKEVRTEEAIAASKVLGVTPIFLDFEIEHLDVNKENIVSVKKVIHREAPDIIAVHWPVDTHIDHCCCGTVLLRIFLENDTDFHLYFYEVMTGRQSMNFSPTHYVDISGSAQVKHESLLCHKSQDGEGIWQDHELMHAMRGRECGVERAEGYIKIERKGTVGDVLPGLIH